MANKYIIEGAAFYGDGTSSAEAASNGGVGAWNTVAIFEGTAPTYGSAPAAGDTVFIRSKTSAGADITRTLAANTNLGSSVPTAATAPVRWVIDGGATWSGINGALTYRRAGNFTLALRAYNVFDAEVEDKLVFSDEYTAAAATTWLTVNAGVVTRNMWLDHDNVTFSSNGSIPITIAAAGGVTLINPRLTLGNKWFNGVIANGDQATLVLINPRIELTALYTLHPVFLLNNFGSHITAYGGSISGVGATTGAKVAGVSAAASSARGASFYGTAIPKTMSMLAADQSGPGSENRFDAIGLDGGLGAMRVQRYGYVDSRSDGFYPVLNASYPNSSASGWSWKMFPVNTTFSNQIELPLLKAYAEVAGTKTVTVEILVGDTFSAVNKGTLWVDLFYVDNTTGLPKFVSSIALSSSAALDTSAAAWSATTWGAIGLLKRKIALTTPTTVKQDTMLIAVLRGTVKSSSANDILFIDPDPQLT